MGVTLSSLTKTLRCCWITWSCWNCADLDTTESVLINRVSSSTAGLLLAHRVNVGIAQPANTKRSHCWNHWVGAKITESVSPTWSRYCEHHRVSVDKKNHCNLESQYWHHGVGFDTTESMLTPRTQCKQKWISSNYRESVVAPRSWFWPYRVNIDTMKSVQSWCGPLRKQC